MKWVDATSLAKVVFSGMSMELIFSEVCLSRL
jgi:hypothetical protein